MANFIQLHFLTPYPPSNPNRDDLGHPKSAIYGGCPRLRISSQSIKRAARLSPAMQLGLEGHLGKRTKRIGEEIKKHLEGGGVDKEKAVAVARKLAQVFGKVVDVKEEEKDSVVQIKQLAFISPEERSSAFEVAEELARAETNAESAGADKGEKKTDKKGKKKVDETEKFREQILKSFDGAVDIAMFGRMLADSPQYNREAAIQVSHAITTHKAIIEDDYFTAVDDLKEPSEDTGAGHLGDSGFGSGIYYLYVCIDCRVLIENLAGTIELAQRGVKAIIEAFATATPSGKRSSYAHHTRAQYIRAEVGDIQPRSLAAAFIKPVDGEDVLFESIQRLDKSAEEIEACYGKQAEDVMVMNVPERTESLEKIQSFVVQHVSNNA